MPRKERLHSLTTLLLPALSRAKTAADNVVCLNNLQQQAIRFPLYAADTGVSGVYRVYRV